MYFCSVQGAGAFDKHAMLTLPPGCALGRDFRLDTLYSVGAGEDWDPITLLEDTFPESHRLPEGLLPIASDHGESLLLLGTADLAGAYVWDHEHRGLTDGQLERCVGDLKYAMVDTEQLDIDQILLLWDEMFPARVVNPSGYRNMYRVADSYTDALMVLREVLSTSRHRIDQVFFGQALSASEGAVGERRRGSVCPSGSIEAASYSRSSSPQGLAAAASAGLTRATSKVFTQALPHPQVAGQ